MAMTDIEMVLPGKITFGEAQVMDRIKQVGLAHSISATYANDPFRKGKFLVKIILELVQCYGMEEEGQRKNGFEVFNLRKHYM